MTDAAANGERFLAIAGHSLTVRELAAVLRDKLGARAAHVARRELPIWLTRLVALANPGVRVLLPQLGKNLDASGDKARRLLGWVGRPIEQTIVDTAESLMALAHG